MTLLSRFSRSRTLAMWALCAACIPLAACKKEEAAPAAAPTPEAAAPAAAAPAAETPAKPDPTTPLTAKWPAGKRLLVRAETQTELEMGAPGTAVVNKTDSQLVHDIAFIPLAERPGGGSEVEVQITSVTVENRGGGKVVSSFDPKADPKMDARNTLAPTLRKLIGAKLKYHTLADGKIEKVDGVPQLLSRLNTGATPQAMFLVRSLVNEDAIKSWNTLHLGLPAQPVQPGNAWEVKRDIPFGPTKFTLAGTNTFKAWAQRNNKRMAQLVFTGTMTTKEGATGPVTLGEGATVTGTSWYDPDLGIIEEAESLSQFTVNVAQSTGQTMTSKYKAKQTSKLVELSDSSSGTPAVTEANAPATTAAPKTAAPK